MNFIAGVICPYCNCYTNKANIEHIVPVSRVHLLGPVPIEFEFTNTTRACITCNSQKSDLLPHDSAWHTDKIRSKITKQTLLHVSRVICRWYLYPWGNIIQPAGWKLYIEATKHGKGGNAREALLCRARDRS